jgi:primosomal protein N' (replication factor Y)
MVGYGTEKVQESLQQLLQGAVIERLDRDTVQRKGSYERILGAFRRKETDILVGTQMLAKGHDFPAVTLVGVLGADQGLKFADFRAAERTFQLLTQVAGRAGRGEIPGEVIIQTFYPHHYSLRTSITQEYEQFSNQELKYRQSLRYPPFVALASILVRGNDFESVWGTARSFAKLVIEIRDEISSRTRMRIFGPAAAAIERLKKDFRVQILVKSNDRILIHELLLEALRRCPERNIDLRKISIDIDPVDLL